MNPTTVLKGKREVCIYSFVLYNSLFDKSRLFILISSYFGMMRRTDGIGLVTVESQIIFFLLFFLQNMYRLVLLIAHTVSGINVLFTQPFIS